MGQHTSRHAGEHSSPRPTRVLPHLSPSHSWPRWASSLTQGLPPEGDRGLFRGEFILVQAPMSRTMGRREDAHPRVANLFRHQFRSHTVALPDPHSSEMPQIRRQGIIPGYGHYDNKSMARDTGPVHLTVPQSRGFTKNLRHQLGHITEEEEDVASDDVNHWEDDDKHVTHINVGKETGSGSRSLYRHDEDDEAADEDYNEDDDEVSGSSDEQDVNVKRHFSSSADEGVPYHYFANNMVKPFLVTSQRYGSFQTMTSRYRTPCPLPRPSVRSPGHTSSQLRHTKQIGGQRSPSEKGTSKSHRNGVALHTNGNTFESSYAKHGLTDHTTNYISHYQTQRNWNTEHVPPDYEPCDDYTEIPSYTSTAKIYDDRRPRSPMQDYSSSESGISEDYRFMSKYGQRSSPGNSEARKTSSSDDSSSHYKRRKSSSADSAMKDFDVLSSFSSDDEDRGDEVFKRHIRSNTQGSPSPRDNTVRRVIRRVSDSSTNSNISTRRNKMRNSLRRAGKCKRGKLEEIGAGNELWSKGNDKTNEDIADTVLLRRQKNIYRSSKTLHSENSWPQLKSCLLTDDTAEMAVTCTLHNDSFLGANELRRSSLPYRDVSLDSDYGELNKTGKSSRSASHKSVAFADETLDTSLANSSSKNMSKSLADIINNSLTDGTFTSRRFSRSKSSPEEPSQETPSSKISNQAADDSCEEQESKVKIAGSTYVLYKPQVLQKTTRSHSADSFLSTSNCTDKIKKLQDILIKQALPFARPVDMLLAQSMRSAKTEGATDNGQVSAENSHNGVNGYILASINQESLVSINQESLASTKQERLASVKQESLASAKQESLASVKQESLASVKQESLASVKQESLASVKQESLASVKQESLASVKQESLASVKQESLASIKQEVKQHIWHSKSDGDLVIDHKPLADLAGGHASSLVDLDKQAPSETVVLLNMGAIYENPSTLLHPPLPPPPPPPPAPPLPDFFKKGMTLLRTHAVTEVGIQFGERQPHNISIIKVNKTNSARQRRLEDTPKPELKCSPTLGKHRN